MVICPECQTKNSVDSQFCKACGVAIPRDAASEAQAKLDALTSEGYAALHEGRTEEAFLISQNVLEEAPENIRALSLKGMALERHGKIPEALETFEKVVALNPDSALDKIKVQQLRNALTAQTLQAPAPSKSRAGIAAVAATLMVVSLGIAGAMFANQGQAASPESDKNLTQTNPGAMAFGNANPTNPAGGNQDSRQSPQQNPQQPTGGTQQPTQGSVRDIQGTPRQGNGRTLPDVNGGGVNLDGEIAPVQPSGLQINPQGGNPQPTNPPDRREDIDPDVDGPRRNSGETQVPKDNPGVIDIQVSRPNPTNGGSRNADAGNSGGGSLEALTRTAREQFMLSKFADAARTYERALAAGGDPATINQRIGQCYKNLNRNADAVQAFKRAQAAIESRIARGGDTSRLQAQLDAVKQELKLLQG